MTTQNLFGPPAAAIASEIISPFVLECPLIIITAAAFAAAEFIKIKPAQTRIAVQNKKKLAELKLLTRRRLKAIKVAPTGKVGTPMNADKPRKSYFTFPGETIH